MKRKLHEIQDQKDEHQKDHENSWNNRRLSPPFLPAEIYKEIFNYIQLKDLNNVAMTCKLWFEITKQIKMWDIVLVCDITESENYYAQLLNLIYIWRPILDQKKIRLGFVGYRDHLCIDKSNSTSLPLLELKSLNFPGNIIKFMEQIECDGGEDEPEAVLDGLNAAIKMKWLPKAKKHLILIADAPPHGQNFHDKPNEDTYPDGCPCGLDELQICQSINKQDIKFWFINTCVGGDYLDKTANVFRNIIPNLKYIKGCWSDDPNPKPYFTLKMNQILEEILEIKNYSMELFLNSLTKWETNPYMIALECRKRILSCVKYNWNEKSLQNLKNRIKFHQK